MSDIRTKEVFLERLRWRLSHLPNNQIQDILYDYEEHFQVGLERGEREEDIIKKLGSPSSIAAQYKFEMALDEAEPVFGEKKSGHFRLIKLMLTAIGLGFFNIVFVLGFYIAVVTIVLGGLLSGFAIAMAGLFSFLFVFFPDQFFFVRIPILMGSLPANLFVIFASIFTVCAGLMLTAGMVHIARLLYDRTYGYLRHNIEIIRRAGE